MQIQKDKKISNKKSNGNRGRIYKYGYQSFMEIECN